jgi:DNA invertase Pin-like site-specific DNA recombinase
VTEGFPRVNWTHAFGACWKEMVVMLLAYVRCSTGKQTLTQQIDQLRAAGCERKHIYKDKAMSAKAKTRPGLMAVVDALEHRDTFMVTAIDRAFRNTVEAITFLDEVIIKRDLVFISLRDRIDPRTPDGRRQYIRIAADAEYESTVTAIRTHQKMAALKRRGRRFGQRRKLSQKGIAWARKELVRGRLQCSVARQLRVCPRTLSRALRQIKLK